MLLADNASDADRGRHLSTEDQTPLLQSQALNSAGCTEIFEEHASGGNRARPVLARVLERTGKGDTLVVMRIDRLARSLSHLLEVIEQLDPDITLQAICDRLEAMRERTPRGRASW